jgi:hypothetical protein
MSVDTAEGLYVYIYTCFPTKSFDKVQKSAVVSNGLPARDMWKAVRVRPIEEGVKGHQRRRRRLEAIQALRAMQPAVKGYPAAYGSSIGGYSATLKVSILDRQQQRLRLSPAP